MRTWRVHNAMSDAGATGYIESKAPRHGGTGGDDSERLSAADSGAVTALRPIRSNCEQCHWPAKFFGSREVQTGPFPVRRAEYALGNRHAGACRRWDASGPVAAWEFTGMWPARSSMSPRMPREQNIPWVRAVNPLTGAAKVYTSQPNGSTATPAGEIRTMDCVDCHNRPTHIFEAPDRSVDEALAEWKHRRVSSVYQAAGRSGACGDLRRSRPGDTEAIDKALRTYYQKTYPQVYTGKQDAIKTAIASVQKIYNNYFFPAMKVRWDTYFTNDTHFYSVRVLPLPRRPA